MQPLEQIAKDMADGFEQLRKDMLGPNAKMLLLREEGEDEGKPFSVVRVVPKRFCPRSNDYFGTITFRVGDISAPFGDDVRRSTHLVVRDSVVPALNNVIHELKSSTTGPDTNKPFWRIRAESMRTLYIDGREQ